MSPRTPALLDADLEAGLKRLKLAAVRKMAPEVLQTAKVQRWAPDELLRTLVEAEIAARDASNEATRRRAAGFPVSRRLEDFVLAESSLPRATFEHLASLDWIDAAENVVLVGPAGTGKSHLLLGIGETAVVSGRRVRYLPAASLVEILYGGLADNSVGRVIERLLRHDLVIIDDLGFAPPSMMSAASCSSASWPPPTSTAAWEWPATGPSNPGVASYPSTPPRWRCSIDSSITRRPSSRAATPIA
jgi:DNA replication protein DnaC